MKIHSLFLLACLALLGNVAVVAGEAPDEEGLEEDPKHFLRHLATNGCRRQSDCSSDRYCASSGQCRSKRQNGVNCNANYKCLTSNCQNGVCRNNAVEPGFCTYDVRTCPDGSSVGRDPSNNCAFYPCRTQPGVCTYDVKTCPDGSSVGRDPRNNCAFTPCPTHGCTRNRDCRNGEYCGSDGRCYADQHQGGCRGNYDCRTGQYCSSGRCYDYQQHTGGNQCNRNRDCGYNRYCNRGYCYYQNGGTGSSRSRSRNKAGACKTGQDCGKYEWCDANKECRSKVGLKEACTSNQECESKICHEKGQACHEKGQACKCVRFV